MVTLNYIQYSSQCSNSTASIAASVARKHPFFHTFSNCLDDDADMPTNRHLGTVL
jgi:hypothetical protein